jgi:hypothetical protein
MREQHRALRVEQVQTGEADFEVLGDAGQVAQQVSRGATVNGHRRFDDEQARALLFHEATLG